MKESFDENGTPCYKGEDGLPIVYINQDYLIIRSSFKKSTMLLVDKKILKEWFDDLAKCGDFTQKMLWFAESTYVLYGRWENEKQATRNGVFISSSKARKTQLPKSKCQWSKQ